MSLSSRFEIIVARHIGNSRARELSDHLDVAYGTGGAGSLSGRGEQLMCILIGKKNGLDFKESADSAGTPARNRCEQLLATTLGEIDASEARSLMAAEYGEYSVLSLPGRVAGINDFLVQDVGGGAIEVGKSGEVNLRLSVSSGLLTIQDTTGLSFSVGDGDSDSVMEFTGSVSDVNSALETLTYLTNSPCRDLISIDIPNSDDPSDSVIVWAGDGASSASIIVSETAVHGGVPVHVSPVIAGEPGEPLQLTISTSYGTGATFTLGDASLVVFNDGEDGSGLLQFTGTTEQINAALADSTISVAGDPDFTVSYSLEQPPFQASVIDSADTDFSFD